ncbi:MULTISPECIES: hypothetical protein [Vibrio]|uniref:hypothetical protein n=1 Tax=Vibrio TaxID=662 RepID=UPI00078D11B4|nr:MULTISPECIES: hypothetical protein [Vibrio]BAU70888.1 hypothetical protein [Vibrio sp. 04Ya108]BBM67855.1 hypothetical protein VA249_45010 [Vibrio alfacsensis]BCN27025.1 hypothetical protein VYA_42170 [Vibrio alfacsensis]
MTNAEKGLLISSAYLHCSKQPEVVAFKELIRTTRKFGFPIVLSLVDKTDEQKIYWAAKLLLKISKAWELTEIPDTLEIGKGSTLYRDAEHLVKIASSNSLNQ